MVGAEIMEERRAFDNQIFHFNLFFNQL